MAERSLERECTFTVPADFAPDLTGLVEVGPAQVLELDATYHDTLGCALADAGWSLRRRVGGHDAGWHLKRPAADGARTEVWVPTAESDAEVIPDALRQEAREVTATAAIVPVARLRTTRHERALLVDGIPAATWCVDHVRSSTAAGVQAWSEVEVELTDGAPDALLEQVAARFRTAGAGESPFVSKVSRALAAVPRLVAPSGPDAPAADVLVAWAARQVGVLQSLEAGVLVDAPDHVHKSRVATRRLRSLLKTFARLFDTERTDPLRAELRWLGEILGRPRDAEVLAEEFEKLLIDLGDAVAPDVRSGLLAHLATEHEQAHAALVAELAGPRAAALRAALVDLLLDPPLRRRAHRPAREVLPPLRAKAVGKVARLRERAEAEPSHLEGWHEVRKAAKAVRYATEAMVGALPDLEPEASAWEDVTEALGELQDSAVARDLIAQVARSASEDPTQAPWAVLTRTQDERGAAARAEGRVALAAVLDAD
ncbi:MAG: CYTH and CHAD domain-containing protein [Propionibacteriaceae bacterium]|nr:CYTH and CHAD domain-containing protein [Propionibacteriaceae bacterium]